jgi:SAM-dependent methyltransferase
MPYLHSHQLDVLPVSEALSALCRRFSWLRQEKEFLARCLQWQADACPRPNFYFRWHLPRFVATLEAIRPCLQQNPHANILDIAAFAPYAALSEEHSRRAGYEPVWTRTSLDGKTERFLLDGKPLALPMTPLELHADVDFPFPNETFNLALFNETIEHLHCHPQFILNEINRVLKPNGSVLITTPNAAGWKKIVQLANGVLEFDSPTWGNEWGHRFEYSIYHLRKMLNASGFEAVQETVRDVYFDDPQGVRSSLFLAGVLGGKILSGDARKALRLWKYRGSGLFFLYRKTGEPTARTPDQFEVI